MAPTPPTTVEIHQQLDELRQRVQGMEGKLRESALARKSADQGRMEAERRLAEGNQARDELHDQIQRLSDIQADLEQRLTDREAAIARLTAELLDLRATNASLADHLERLQRTLPPAEGGTLTVEEARSAAADAVRSLRDARRDVDKRQESGATQAVQEAEVNLRRMQFRLANSMGARGLYRVRANDTLASISGRFHGNSGQWREIFEANRHLLADPNQLAPGMTLVIP